MKSDRLEVTPPAPCRPLLRSRLRRLSSGKLVLDQRGLSTVEYVIILVLIAAVCVATWTAFGRKVKEWLGMGTQTIDQEINGGLGLSGDDGVPPGNAVSPGGPGGNPPAGNPAAGNPGNAAGPKRSGPFTK